jgi:hypothetical protein
MTRNHSVKIALTTLLFFRNSAQGTERKRPATKGFYQVTLLFEGFSTSPLLFSTVTLSRDALDAAADDDERRCSGPLRDLAQRRAHVHGDVLGLIALDLVLRFILGGVARMPLVLGVARVKLDNSASDVPSLRIPSDVIADLKSVRHNGSPLGAAFRRDARWIR